MRQRATQGPEAEWLSYNERMDYEGIDERPFTRLQEHLIKLVDYHLLEIRDRLVTKDDHRRVIQFQRIGHG